jgi:hypothetical protein
MDLRDENLASRSAREVHTHTHKHTHTQTCTLTERDVGRKGH